MLEDEDKAIRKEALDKIKAVRAKGLVKIRTKIARGVRLFKVPQLNWEATSYTRMIDWQKSVVTEPPVVKSFSDDMLKQVYSQPLNLPDYSVHTQSVERAVKLVSEASKEVYGGKARHSLILSRLESREQRPSYDTKREYTVKNQ